MLDLAGRPREASIDDVGDDLPVGMGGHRVRVLTVRPHEVEAGDFLVGLPRTQVAGVLYDGASGRWLYSDGRDVLFASRRPWDRVRVVRGSKPVRHLRVVR